MVIFHGELLNNQMVILKPKLQPLGIALDAADFRQAETVSWHPTLQAAGYILGNLQVEFSSSSCQCQ